MVPEGFEPITGSALNGVSSSNWTTEPLRSLVSELSTKNCKKIRFVSLAHVQPSQCLMDRVLISTGLQLFDEPLLKESPDVSSILDLFRTDLDRHRLKYDAKFHACDRKELHLRIWRVEPALFY